MTKVLSSALALVALLAIAPAHADVARFTNGPLYSCSLAGTVSGRSIAIIVGGQVISGPGRITCIDVKSGRKIKYPVTLKLQGIGFGLDLSEIKSMQIVSAGIGVNDPALFGQSFSLGATAGATLIHAGISFDVAVRANARDGFGFELGLTGKEVTGLGAHVYAMGFSIEGRKN